LPSARWSWSEMPVKVYKGEEEKAIGHHSNFHSPV
jgi:hypothetical protein